MNLEFKNGATSLIAQAPTVAGLVLDYLGNQWYNTLGTLPFCIALADTGPNYGVRIPVHLLGQREGYPSFEKGNFLGCNGYAQLAWTFQTTNPGELVVARNGGIVQSVDTLTDAGTYWVIGQAVTGGNGGEKITIIDCTPTQYVVS